MKQAVVIGSGFAGLSAATFMANAGWDVTVIEQHNIPGGRARKFTESGFTFDMGPSWYWMPEVFERYFNCFGKKVSDYYELERLDPSYKIYSGKTDMEIPSDLEKLKLLFETLEPGAGKMLDNFLKEAEYKYEIGIKNLVHKPGLAFSEFIEWDVVKGVIKMDVFTSMSKHIRKYFRNKEIIQILEFPVLFLGALPSNIPALYSLMNYADIKLGTWYPKGGMYEIVKGMHTLAEEKGVKFRFETKAVAIEINGGVATGVHVSNKGNKLFIKADVIIGGADYHYIETELLPENSRSYTNQYWDSRIMAPSCLLYYIGINKKLKNITHHTLFFDSDFEKHGSEIYADPKWPTEPLFYVCAPSVTDTSVAPQGKENLFFLIPVASGLKQDSEDLRNFYFEKIVKRFEDKTGENISEHIEFKRSYSVSDFVHDYGSFKGNAYGLANTLLQTALFKPSLKSKKVKNLFYTGQLTVPGPGVPPSLISGEVVSKQILKEFSK